MNFLKYKVILICMLGFLISSCNKALKSQESVKFSSSIKLDSTFFDEQSIVNQATIFLSQSPRPITLTSCERSVGELNDFYSEGDYWWPDPENPDGPYIRKDGLTNPNNFNDHREAMRNLNEWVSTLVAAYVITMDEKFASHALAHLDAFFLIPTTKMNPNLLYAQAIKGRFTGRGIGIIDSIHLIEITRAIKKLIELGYLKEEKEKGLKEWFEAYAMWMNSHPYGIAEKNHGNNHSTWWSTQMAAFSDLCGRTDLEEVAIVQFKKMLDSQMDENGQFPEEIGRTKPYSYTLFNLEAYAVTCQILSNNDQKLWNYTSTNGTLEKAWEFMFPYIKDKSTWIKDPDILHFDEFPIQTAGFLFTGLAYNRQDFLELWKTLDPEKKSEEMKRTFPVYQPILWF